MSAPQLLNFRMRNRNEYIRSERLACASSRCPLSYICDEIIVCGCEICSASCYVTRGRRDVVDGDRLFRNAILDEIFIYLIRIKCPLRVAKEKYLSCNQLPVHLSQNCVSVVIRKRRAPCLRNHLNCIG